MKWIRDNFYLYTVVAQFPKRDPACGDCGTIPTIVHDRVFDIVDWVALRDSAGIKTTKIFCPECFSVNGKV